MFLFAAPFRVPINRTGNYLRPILRKLSPSGPHKEQTSAAQSLLDRNISLRPESTTQVCDTKHLAE